MIAGIVLFAFNHSPLCRAQAPSILWGQQPGTLLSPIGKSFVSHSSRNGYVAGNHGADTCPRTALNPNGPLAFFSTLADKMLKNTFSVGLTNIPVYVNGQFVYTPAVNRILQLAANIYDASTNSFYPDVFRPIFEHDSLGNVFIVGYTNVSSASGLNTVSGTDDLQFLAPLDVEALAEMGATNTPITESGNPVNVYGVPWIIGAKKYLPGFNQFSLLNVVRVDRRLQVARDTLESPIHTNHMYLLSISNFIGASFWNSYSNDYSSPSNGLSVIFADFLQMTLTNSDHPGVNTALGFGNFFDYKTNVWPGSHWSHVFGQLPDNNSFIAASWTNVFFSDVIYKTGAKLFASLTDPDPWETNNTSCDPLPQFGLITTNWLRAIILDNGHVVDYVQLRGPIDSTNVTKAIADPPYVGQPYLWATNGYGDAPEPSWGYVSQIDISRGTESPIGEAIWQPDYPPIFNSVVAGTAFFEAYFNPSHQFEYDGGVFYDTNLVTQAGYLATRTIFVPYLYQINDPLVHYLASDLDVRPVAAWHDVSLLNGIWQQNNGVTASYPIPSPPYGADITRGHYQPWGVAAPPALQTVVYDFGNPYNLTYKDPGVWDSDYWNFPTNLLTDLTGLGQVHRGTPWQTVYLKSGNIITSSGATTGTNTWATWIGDLNLPDAATCAPVNDWPLASLLIAMLNTNDIAQQMSVNDPNLADWLNVLNGLTAYSNTTELPPFALRNGFQIPQTTFNAYVMAGNSSQAETIADGISQAKAAQPNQDFYFIGDVLSAPELTVDSPWLNTTNVNEQAYGITDVEYEAIPAQLLLRLRPDSIGALSLTNGSINLEFTGSDAFSYELQQSTDLAHWTRIGTFHPVQSVFNVSLPRGKWSSRRFYRSVLLPRSEDRHYFSPLRQPPDIFREAPCQPIKLFLDGRDEQAAKDKGADEHSDYILGGGHN